MIPPLTLGAICGRACGDSFAQVGTIVLCAGEQRATGRTETHALATGATGAVGRMCSGVDTVATATIALVVLVCLRRSADVVLEWATYNNVVAAAVLGSLSVQLAHG